MAEDCLSEAEAELLATRDEDRAQGELSDMRRTLDLQPIERDAFVPRHHGSRLQP